MPDTPTTTSPSEKTKRFAAIGEMAPVDINAWMAGYRQAFDNWMQSGDGLMKRAASLSEELMSFSRNRLQADIEAWQAIASCRSPTDFFECQRQYAEKASSDYLEEASKLTTGMVAFLSDVAAPLRSPVAKGQP